MTKKKAPVAVCSGAGATDSPTVSRTPPERSAQGRIAPPDSGALDFIAARAGRAANEIERARRDLAVRSQVERAIAEMDRARRTIGEQLRQESPVAKSIRCLLETIEDWNEGVLLSESSTPDEKLEAARYLAESLPPPTTSKNSSAKREACKLAVKAGYRRADERAEWSQRELLAPALVQVARDIHTPRPIRLGKDWVRGSRKPVAPADLPARAFSKWLRQEAVGIVERSLSDKPRKQLTTFALNEPIANAILEDARELSSADWEIIQAAVARCGDSPAAVARHLRSIAKKISGV